MRLEAIYAEYYADKRSEQMEVVPLLVGSCLPQNGHATERPGSRAGGWGRHWRIAVSTLRLVRRSNRVVWPRDDAPDSLRFEPACSRVLSTKHPRGGITLNMVLQTSFFATGALLCSAPIVSGPLAAASPASTIPFQTAMTFLSSGRLRQKRRQYSPRRSAPPVL